MANRLHLPTHREHWVFIYQVFKLHPCLFFLGTQLGSISQPPLQLDEVTSEASSVFGWVEGTCFCLVFLDIQDLGPSLKGGRDITTKSVILT